jgi:hypothetical protein
LKGNMAMNYFPKPSVAESLVKLFVKLSRSPTKRSLRDMRHSSVYTADNVRLS